MQGGLVLFFKFWCGVWCLDMRALGEMRGKLWIVSRSRLGLRKITRKFDVVSCFCVSVLAVLAWLAWCVG